MLYPNVLMVPKLPILCDIDAVGADCHFRNRDLEYGEYVKETLASRLPSMKIPRPCRRDAYVKGAGSLGRNGTSKYINYQ